ncbi:acyl-CoA dehydrogenase family protein [Acinetobacter baumannii]|uniref:acyl-CoA dehydrogenase family protein n=1 Tax=Acinetobacter baumannii TaxID=470 RepID=UPI00295686BB|nr:acyl-CoA dehydrogenase family protein [Acinetobacter baumannii]MDV7609577.1 acyl-CoA dehydrogenase family protein [Acinetobacter baumannii]MDV7611368.1 acyl-CoA dehydrogenase family protein [Acinetobacter baumannii]MDV7615567.1 acyl-CoA dehydrogenase family protein [Acinetobacter baumannii]
MNYKRTIFDAEHEQFRDVVRRFMQSEIGPYADSWREQGYVDREAFLKTGQQGYFLTWLDEQYGGCGLKDLRYEQIIHEENVYYGDPAFYQNLHSMVVAPYFDKFGTEQQKQKYLPKAASGESILAIAMTESGAGSDLAAMTTRAEDKGDHWLLNGSKTYISNGIQADVVVVAARTVPDQRYAMGLFIVERGMAGFERGKKLKKMGLHGQDTAELFFDNVRIPKENVLGDPTQGFRYMAKCLAVERLQVAIGSVAAAQVAFALTLDYVKNRRAFGKPLGALQDVRFKLADLRASLDAVQCFVDQCVLLANQEKLTAEIASEAKYLATELEGKVTDQCVQLHGGAGYMDEYRISRLYTDARVSRIFAGANEIMLEIIGRGLGLDERKLN